jgi:hypothetical protein
LQQRISGGEKEPLILPLDFAKSLGKRKLASLMLLPVLTL